MIFDLSVTACWSMEMFVHCSYSRLGSFDDDYDNDWLINTLPWYGRRVLLWACLSVRVCICMFVCLKAYISICGTSLAICNVKKAYTQSDSVGGSRDLIPQQRLRLTAGGQHQAGGEVCYLRTNSHGDGAAHTRTHTRLTALCPGLSGWAGTRKVKTNRDFTEARDSEWQWHQLGRVQVGTSIQTDNHASTPPLSFSQAGCSSCRPANSVKALKAMMVQCIALISVSWRWQCVGVCSGLWSSLTVFYRCSLHAGNTRRPPSSLLR